MLTTFPLFDIILVVADSEATRYERECECAGTGRQARLRGVCQSTYGFKSRHSHHLQTQNQICGCGGMADALASGASVRKDVGVQVPPSAPRKVLISNEIGTFLFIKQAYCSMNLVQRTVPCSFYPSHHICYHKTPIYNNVYIAPLHQPATGIFF